jgi:thiamine biosynthesis lipoprotein
MTLDEIAFASMGTRVRVLAADPGRLPGARAEIARLAAVLTRFDPASELCSLNADPRTVVPASADLRAAVRVALAGAALTRGLADPTLLGALERAGYDRSLTGRPRASLAAALAVAPPRRAAAPDPSARWREVTVDDRAGTIARPPGLRLDLGASAKGFIADRAAALLAGAGPCAVDCGGDLRVRGLHRVQVRDPHDGGLAAVLELRDGAIATSGVDARLWEPAGHHVLDPASGTPAWTGVVTATALAPSAAEAEARATAALLSGPLRGLEPLRRHGGVIVRDDGAVLRVGSAARRRVRSSELLRSPANRRPRAAA